MTRTLVMLALLVVSPALCAAQAVPPASEAPRPLPTPSPLPAPAASPVPSAVPVAPVGPTAVPRPPQAPWPPDVTRPVPVAPFDVDLAPLTDLDVNLTLELDRMQADLAGLTSGLDDQVRLSLESARAQASAGLAQQMSTVRAQVDAARRQAFDLRLRSDAYNGGLDALQQRQYERAITAFDRVVADKGPRADAALYWKAFSEFKLARTDAALSTIAQLQKEHAQSRYVSDAKVLEAEVRKQTGQRLDPAQLDDDEIKLLAIQGLQRSEQAVPLLEAVLNGANSLNVKRRALYVLALGPDARAREILLGYAGGAGSPDLQLEAVRLLVSRRDAQTTGAVLRDLYEATSDSTVRRTIIDAYRVRQREGAANTSPLATTATQDLTAMYQRETDAELRRHIVSVMMDNGAVDQVMTMLRGERDPQARTRMIHTLNVRNNPRATQALVSLYGSVNDVPTREAIVSTLAGQQNADALISLAKTESNVQLKTRIVRHLSEMAPRSKAAADYLMDVIR